MPEFFGIYAFVLTSSFVFISVQNALVLSQLAVLRPGAKADGTENALLAMLWTVNVVAIAFAMLATFVIGLIISGSDRISLSAAATAFVGASLLREYIRGYHFSDLRAIAVLALDVIFIAVSGAALSVGFIWGVSLSVDSVLWMLALGQLVAAPWSVIVSPEAFRLSASLHTRQTYRSIWRANSRWALLSVFATEFQQRGHVFVVAAAFGASAVALLQAAAVLFRPVPLIVQAWGKVARSALATYLSRGEDQKARRFTFLSLAGVMVIFALFLGFLALVWPLVKSYIFVGSFSNVETVVIYWSFATGTVLVTGMLGVEAQSRMKFRELSVGAVLGAVATALMLGIAVLAGDFHLSIVAICAGQLVLFIIICRIRRDALNAKDDAGGGVSAAPSQSVIAGE